MILFGLVCLLFSLAGFPVAQYVETANKFVFTHAPRLHGALVGALIMASLVQLAGIPVRSVAENIALIACRGKRLETGKLDVPEERRAAFLSIFLTVFCLGLIGVILGAFALFVWGIAPVSEAAGEAPSIPQ